MTPRAGRTVFAGFVALTVMGIALVLTLFVRLGQEVFVYVQRTFGFVFLLATYHVFTTHGAKAQSPALKWYMAALATAGIAAFAYRSLFHNVLVRRKHYTVSAANRLDDFVTEIVLEPRSKPLVYRAGPVRLRQLPLARAPRLSARSTSRCSGRCSRSAPARSATSSTRSRSRPPPTSGRCGSP